jgi:hypothetical protein
LSLTFAMRVNRTIDGEPAAPALPAARSRPLRWWRPIAGTAVAAGVTAVAVVTWQQRAVAPSVTAAPRVMAQNVRLATVAKEPLSYTVPTPAAAPAMLAPARLTNYVFAHSKYSVGLGQSNLLATLLSGDADAVQSAAEGAGGNAPRASATTAVSPAAQTAP